MPDTLYFIPILADALRRHDLDAGMREAIALIFERRDDPRYRDGFRQFLRFIDAAASSVGVFEQEAITKVALRMMLGRIVQGLPDAEPRAGETPDGEGPRASYAPAIRAMQESAARSAALTVQIRRDDNLIASLPLPQASPAVVRKLRPGAYTIALDTGRLLWSGGLGPADLVWPRAFPDRPLPVAADSAIPSITPTRRIPLVVGSLAAVVYPGVETGTMRLVAERVA